jgi:predicted PurR-regulated permease PerM
MNLQPTGDCSRAIRLIAFVAVIAALYLARDILIPAALAVLLTFVLLPLVRRLESWGLKRAVAVVLTVLVASAISGGVTWIVGKQVLDLSLRLPDYQENLRSKARALRQSGEGPVSRLAGTIRELKEELSTTQPATEPARAAVPAVVDPPEPVKVELVEAGPDVATIARELASPLMVPLAGAAITVVLLIFLLLDGDDFRSRLVSLAGIRRISLTASASSEIAERIGKYLRAQLLINFSYGTMLGFGLWVIGVPNAFLWGVMGFVMRFIPYVGPWLAAVLPTLLAIAVFPGWSRTLAVVALCIGVELITNLLLEPWLYGTSAGISTLGVVVAAVFWAWLWGPVGLIVAVPITVCLVVAGKYVPQLSTLHHLLGSDVDVPEVVRLYQHLLAGNADAADDILGETTKGLPLAEVCDNLLLPVLSELKRDLASGVIDLPQAQRVIDALDLTLPAAAAPDGTATDPLVMCIPGQNNVDQCAARLLAAACHERDISADALPAELLSSESVERTHASGAAHAVVVQVPPISHLHSRRLLVGLTSKLESLDVVDLTFRAADSEPSSLGGDASEERYRRETSFTRVVAELAERMSVERGAAAEGANSAAVKN